MSLEHKLAQAEMGMHRFARAGLAVVVVLVGGSGVWSVLQSIQDAVIAPGTVMVNSQRKTIQHQDGGIVAKINVAEGSHVAAGDVLFQLESKQLRAELGMARRRIFELSARRWRLQGERDSVATLPAWKSPNEVSRDDGDAELTDIVAGQKRLFETKRDVLAKQKDQLAERVNQLDAQVVGLTGQLQSNREQLAVTRKELTALIGLRDKGLLPMTRWMPVQRQEAALAGDVGSAEAQIATAKGQIAEAQLKLLEADEGFRKEALNDLQIVDGELSQLVEKRGALEEKLNRLELRAPVSGRILNLQAHTVGGVIKPGDTLANIVPDKDPLVVEAFVSPREIDRIRDGMPARVRFTAFNSKTTPELNGTVVNISADHTMMAENAPPGFKVRVRLKDGETEQLGQHAMLPGMEAEVLFTSAERTVISYLAKPLTDQIARAFRER